MVKHSISVKYMVSVDSISVKYMVSVEIHI